MMKSEVNNAGTLPVLSDLRCVAQWLLLVVANHHSVTRGKVMVKVLPFQWF